MNTTLNNQHVASIHADSLRVAVILHPVANIVGHAYGAAMCDYASKAARTARVLLDEIGFHSEIYDLTQRIEWPDISVARDNHRMRAGEPPLPRNSRHLIPLTPTEHKILGDDLKTAQRVLASVQCDCSRVSGLRKWADKTNSALLQLRAHMEMMTRREHWNGISGRPIEAIYFGKTLAEGD